MIGICNKMYGHITSGSELRTF